MENLGMHESQARSPEQAVLAQKGGADLLLVGLAHGQKGGLGCYQSRPQSVPDVVGLMRTPHNARVVRQKQQVSNEF